MTKVNEITKPVAQDLIKTPTGIKGLGRNYWQWPAAGSLDPVVRCTGCGKTPVH